MSDNFFNFLDTSLDKLDKSIHNIFEDTFVDDFIHELQDCLEKYHSYDLFKKLPTSTYFHLTGYSGNFLECMAYNEKKIYYVPKGIIIGKTPTIGDALTFANPNNLVINSGGIPLWGYEISKFKNECTIAK